MGKLWGPAYHSTPESTHMLTLGTAGVLAAGGAKPEQREEASTLTLGGTALSESDTTECVVAFPSQGQDR